MGDALKTADLKVRIILLILLLLSIGMTTAAFVPKTEKALTEYRISRYVYNPAQPVVSEVDTSTMSPATAVPILLYHGVTTKPDDSNTTLENFIRQMEMLKRNGYQTISVTEFDLFRQGKFKLPPRPIIITFDDGRKDSYYPTDDVFKKLGFTATMFVATGPAYDGNTFYLGWNELRQMAQSGRWEIEAHGRYSHHHVAISPRDSSPQGDGRYLTSLMYLPDKNRVENVDEYEKRVEDDYINNIQDLETRVGVEPRYFSVPLNDYGQQALSNYKYASVFNHQVIEKYFRLAFIQANNSDDVHTIRLPVYNTAYDDSYYVRRLEVKNMSADFLKSVLDAQRPMTPKLVLKDINYSL